MEELNDKDVFIKKMSDNMQQQLNVISANTTAAKHNLDNLSRIRTCLERIEESSSELSSMIQDAMDLISIKNGMTKLNNEEFSLYSLMERIRDTVSLDAERKHISFDLSFSQLQHDELIGDAPKIMQIMIQLLSNALKFTSEGGSIEVTVEESPSAKSDYTHFQVTIQDSGVGIDADRLAHLFDPLYESAAEDTGERKGQNALGLIVTKGLVDLMAGTIQADSEPGKGSVFSVGLDLQTQAFVPSLIPESLDEEPKGFEGMRFLIAEDSEVSWTISSSLLTEAGALTEHAENGKRALEMFMDNPPGYYDLILMDIYMPLMNGTEASAAIRTSGKADAQTIPIIAMTANPFEHGINHSLESGINAHLSKPLNTFNVMMTISQFF